MKRILVIDDEDVIFDLIRDLCSNRDRLVERAADGDEGVRRARTDPPAVVITDLLLPGCHGFEVVRRLREDPATRSVPIIVLSAKIFPADRAKALALGANAFIEKPFQMEELVAVVDHWCEAQP